MQLPETRSRCHLGRLEHGARHEPAWNLLCRAADGAPNGPAWLWPDHQHRLCDERLRICGPSAVWSQPRRSAATDDESGRRPGQAWDYSEMPCAGMGSEGAKQDAL